MPRPDLTPEYIAELEKHYQDYWDDPPEDAPNIQGLPSEFLEQYKQVFMSGDWLADRLKASGATDEECESICFANGQRCMGSPDVWETAKESLRKFWQGRADKPGMKLAEEITAQVFGGEIADAIMERNNRRKAMHTKYTKFVE